MLLGLATLAIVMVREQFRRAGQLLSLWAEKHGYQVLTKEGANPPGTGAEPERGRDACRYRPIPTTQSPWSFSPIVFTRV